MTPRRKAPEPGAVRCHRLAPARVGDCFAWVAKRLRARGWEPLEVDYDITHGGEYVMVDLWAIPPLRGGDDA